jgi:hypothetical protein
MKNVQLADPSEATALACRVLAWWCPDRKDLATVARVAAGFRRALSDEGWGDYWITLNRLAIGELGYDTEEEEDEVLAYLDGLCRGEI